MLYVVSEDWYFLSHRLPMARAAREAGFEVHVATRVADGGPAIEREGFVLHPIPFARGRLAPFTSLRTILALQRIHRTVDPAIVHHVALQAAVLGTLAAGKRSVARVNALTGLGYAFTSNDAQGPHAAPVHRLRRCAICSTAAAASCWCRIRTMPRRWSRSAFRRSGSSSFQVPGWTSGR